MDTGSLLAMLMDMALLLTVGNADGHMAWALQCLRCLSAAAEVQLIVHTVGSRQKSRATPLANHMQASAHP